jgi:site-specific DNA-cytosine methylase
VNTGSRARGSAPTRRRSASGAGHPQRRSRHDKINHANLDNYNIEPPGRRSLIDLATSLTIAPDRRAHTAGIPDIVGINVLSVFDGIACAAQALQQEGIPIAAYHAVEIDPSARRIARTSNPRSASFGGVEHTLGHDAEDITEADVVSLGPVHLVVGGPPCQDHSKARLLPDRHGQPGQAGAGFEGTHGKLFLKFIEIIGWVRKHNPSCTFLVENVNFDHLPGDYSIASGALGAPTVRNSECVSFTSRERAFWHNIHLPDGWDAPPREEWHANQMLRRGCTAPDPHATITATWSPTSPPKQVTYKPFLVMDKGRPRHLFPDEAERLLGLPTGYTDVAGTPSHTRLHHVGNGMDVHFVRCILRHMRTRAANPAERSIAPAPSWVPGRGQCVGKQPLPVVDIAPWLTSGPCPLAQHGGGWDATMCHPRARYLIEEWAHGVTLRHIGDRSAHKLCENNPSFYTWPEVSTEFLRSNLSSGCLVGPFILPPVSGFLQTPLAMIEQHDKHRAINNAKMGAAINSDIPDPIEPIFLPTHAELQRRARLLSRGGSTAHLWMAKRDIKSAYRNVAVRPEDWNVEGVCVDGQFFLDTALNFGTRSSPDKFLEVSDAVAWVLHRWGIHCVHYIDDFIFLGSSEEEVADMVEKFHVVCDAFGLPIKREKDVGPAQRLTVLGVVYDFQQGTVAMPRGQLDAIRTGCVAAADGSLETRAAASLLGVVNWAAQCLPHTAAPFVPRLRHATLAARRVGARRIKISHGLRDDMRWWINAIDAGMGASGTSFIHLQRAASHVAWGDAGSSWGVGGHDASRFYNARTPPSVMAKAHRKATTSSRFLELYQLLVMARVLGPKWAGSHAKVWVDNESLVPLFRKGYSRRADENDMVREIYTLQAAADWSWEICWTPREANEAADALSKNDMRRFHANIKGDRTRVLVDSSHLLLPGEVADTRSQQLRGSGDTSHIHRDIFLPVDGTRGSLWQRQHQQAAHVRRQLPQPAFTTGVRRYFSADDSFARRHEMMGGEPLTVGSLFPRTPAEMADNVMAFAADCVLSYPFWDGHGMRTKRAVAASTASRYVAEVSAYYDERAGVAHKVHLRPQVTKYLGYLRKSLPSASRQKSGFTRELMTSMVRALRASHGDASMQEALFSLSWFSLLRPGEVTTTSRYPRFDISRHPALQDVTFWRGSLQVTPGGDLVPDRMVLVIKDSKTDKFRLTKEVVIGASHDAALCALNAMWAYLATRSGEPATSPLFVHAGRAVPYSRLRLEIDAALRVAGIARDELRDFGGHSFRIGGAQALVLAEKPIAYVMSLGRWSCIESLLTYVETPLAVRLSDAHAMVSAAPAVSANDARRTDAAVRAGGVISANSSRLAASRRR